MKTVSIGYHREDGDFAVLATLNNNDEHMSDNAFGDLVDYVASKLYRKLLCKMVVLKRQDAPDYVTIEGEDK